MKVILICAVTVDGKIAKSSVEPIDWTSKEDKTFFKEQTKKIGVVIVGHNTWKVLGKPLKGRLWIVLTSHHAEGGTRFSSAARGSYPQEEKPIPGILEFTGKNPKEIFADLENRGFKTAVVAGGGKINALFLKNGLIDELWLTVEPRIFGTGISLFDEEDLNLNATLLSIEKLNKNSYLVKYKLNNEKN